MEMLTDASGTTQDEAPHIHRQTQLADRPARLSSGGADASNPQGHQGFLQQPRRRRGLMQQQVAEAASHQATSGAAARSTSSSRKRLQWAVVGPAHCSRPALSKPSRQAAVADQFISPSPLYFVVFFATGNRVRTPPPPPRGGAETTHGLTEPENYSVLHIYL